ncbi:MAG: PAS domain S-box protein [Candidatus Thiodiazotropha sp. (ex Dulcina madagascariensis)]|nr:PAS domain S-box protein [Candidatus Thiodiazotropha sp. (ex Dulcina madagascariensis)]
MISSSTDNLAADLLVVDDTPESLKLLTSLLREQGYSVRAALNGSMALGSVVIQPPDLILLDIKMPEMDGFEVCAELKRREESRDIPIIFISAQDEPRDKVLAFELGGVDYITKPFEANEVLARVRTQLSIAQTTHELEQRVQERTAKLAASEAKYRRLVESLEREYIFYVHDINGVFTYISPSVRNVLGYRSDDFLTHYTKYLTDHPLNMIGKSYSEAAIRGEIPPPYEIEIRAQSGSIHWLEVVEQPVFDETGIVMAVEGIAHDITERRALNEKLRESERHLLEAQQMAHIGNWELDLTTNTLYWSDEIYRIFGIDPEGFEATYEAFLDTIHPNDRARVDRAYSSAVSNNIPYEMTHRITRKSDGKVRYVHEHSKEIRNDAGVVVRSLGTVQDVTELERASRSLRMLSDVNQALVYGNDEKELLQRVCRIIVSEGGYQMAWVGYPENDQERSITPAAQAGYEAGSLSGLDRYWADSELGSGPTGNAIRTRQPFVVHNTANDPCFTPWREKAMARGHLSVAGLPLRQGAELFGSLTICSSEVGVFDEHEIALLTELADDLAFGINTIRARVALDKHQQHLEELVELRTIELQSANERLMELDRLKSMFIASMSHELRTPLNSIISFSGILLQGLVGELNERQRDSVARVQRAGRHLLDLISDVIDISKIEAGYIDVYSEDINIKEVVNEALDSIRRQAREKGLNLLIDVPAWPVAHTDRQRLLQCLINLLSNAVKYTEQGSITLSIKSDKDEIQFAVSDTGIGIAEHDKAKLFKAFERLDSHLRVKAGGAGLGLYLIKKIVAEILQGSVSLESELGKGSTFILTIPKKAMAEVVGQQGE